MITTIYAYFVNEKNILAFYFKIIVKSLPTTSLPRISPTVRKIRK